MSERWRPRRSHSHNKKLEKLSQEDLDRLFDDWDTGRYLQRELAAKYGLAQQRVSQLLRWRRKKEFAHFYPRSQFFKDLVKSDVGWVPGSDDEE